MRAWSGIAIRSAAACSQTPRLSATRSARSTRTAGKPDALLSSAFNLQMIRLQVSIPNSLPAISTLAVPSNVLSVIAGKTRPLFPIVSPNIRIKTFFYAQSSEKVACYLVISR